MSTDVTISTLGEIQVESAPTPIVEVAVSNQVSAVVITTGLQGPPGPKGDSMSLSKIFAFMGSG